jgi:hypothetical protein
MRRQRMRIPRSRRKESRNFRPRLSFQRPVTEFVSSPFSGVPKRPLGLFSRRSFVSGPRRGTGAAHGRKHAGLRRRGIGERPGLGDGRSIFAGLHGARLDRARPPSPASIPGLSRETTPQPTSVALSPECPTGQALVYHWRSPTGVPTRALSYTSARGHCG